VIPNVAWKRLRDVISKSSPRTTISQPPGAKWLGRQGLLTTVRTSRGNVREPY
jgi:hypothetical protein